jgi:hypothetical protein
MERKDQEQGYKRMGGLGVQSHGRLVGDVDPHVNVGIASEMPHEAWAFESPVVPGFVPAGVFVGVERQVEFFQPTLGFQTRENFLAIDRSEGLDKFGQDLLERFALVACKLADGDTRNGVQAPESNGAFAWRLGHLSQLALLPIEHSVNAIGRKSLLPEYVAWVIRSLIIGVGRMTVENRSTEGYVLLCIAIASESRVTACQHEFEPL